MDWFSKNFPTLAKLISTLGKTTQRPSGARKQTARRRTTRSTTDDARQAADTAVSNLADGPLPVTEGTEHVDPVQSEEVSPDLAPSRIDLDVPTPVAEEATPPISAEQATPVAGGATPSISAGMATPVAGEATPSIFAGEFTPVPAAASPSIFPGELDERPAGREEPTTRPTETGKPIVSDSVDTAQSTSMAQMYNTWVELGETITSARAEMHNLLTNRRQAEALRAEAQEMMEQAEAAWDEAGRLGVVARNAIERGFTVNLPGFAARLRMVDEIEQARMTQAQLRRSNNLEAWEEADRAKQKATTELLKALAAIAVATSQAERELRETANLPALAGALRDSANEDLECARDIGEELAQLGREAFSLLAVSDATVEASADEKPIPVPITGQSETPPVQSVPATHAAPERQEAVVVGGVMEAQDTQGTRAVPETREEQPSVSRADIGTGGNRTPGVIEAAPVVTEVFEASPVSAADQLRREFEAAGSTTGTGGSGIQGVVEQSNEDLGSPVPGLQEAAKHNSAAEELERELAALRSQLTSTGPPAESAAVSGGVAGFGTQDQSSEPDSGGFLRRGELDTSSGDLPEAVAPAPASEPEPSSPVPETYSGRVYLMFPATLTQDQLESVWDSLEEVGGSGSISDHRLVSRQDGVQFTLELGNKDLVVDRLRKQMPGAGLTALAADRLGIDWPKRA